MFYYNGVEEWIMTGIAGYRFEDKLSEDALFVLYRAVREPAGAVPRRVILKTCRRKNPDARTRAKLRRDYEISRGLRFTGILSPIELTREEERPVLILEDFDCTTLEYLLNAGAVEPVRFLSLATALSEIMGELHENRIVHRNITPQNVLINGGTGRMKLCGFEHASPSANGILPGPSRVSQLEGTLAYLSPEQTGRMNRTVDYRSDLYALGVVFYKMLTGRLPFRHDDPQAMVHAHMAKIPEPPHRVLAGIPPALSALVMKLLSKAPEDRYQSTYGLLADLKRCIHEQESSGYITDFEPGLADRSALFKVSRRMYGRERDLETLRKAYKRVCSGEVLLTLIAGHSGIGKTTLERAFHREVSRGRMLYLRGKFDRLQGTVPYSGFMRAFSELIDRILLSSGEQLDLWRERFTDAVGTNGQVIVDMIPQLELIIGKQQPVPELPPPEAENRFNTVTQRFIGALSDDDNPVILFLDDLHWADPASLNLLQILTHSPDLRYMLLMGAYRDNEVDESHPLNTMIEKLHIPGEELFFITLPPLGREHVEELVSDTLLCEQEHSRALAHLVHQKTGGNPFLVNEFMRDLQRAGHFIFDLKRGRWSWDLDEILQTDLTDDLAMLMTDKIRRLSKSGQRVLTAAACIGNRFDLDTLAAVNGRGISETLEELQEPISEGLVLPVAGTAAFIPPEHAAAPAGEQVRFVFLHDRVQQAAHSILGTKRERRLHLKIARIMLEHTTAEGRYERICEIADHMNRGRDLVDDEEERLLLAEMNLEAGRKARASVAYESAYRYMATGHEMLADHGWELHYDVMLALHLEGAEAAYLSGQFEASSALTNSVLVSARTLLDRVRAHEIVIHADIAQNRYGEAVEKASKILNLLGVFLPKNPGRLRILLGLLRTKFLLHGVRLEDLLELPPMTDPYKLAAMRILMSVFNPFYRSIREMFPSIAFRMVILSIKYGNSSISPFAYALYGLLLGLVGEIEEGSNFGVFALRLFQRFDSRELTAKMYNVIYALMNKWKTHLRDALNPLLEAYRSGLETGDLEWAAYALRGYCIQLFFSGGNLTAVGEETERFTESLKGMKHTNTMYTLMLLGQVVLNLTAYAEDRTSLRGERFNDEEMLPLLGDARDTDTIAGVRFFKCLLSYLFGDYGAAYEIFRDIEAHQETRGQFGFVLEARFYFSLVLLAVYHILDRKQQRFCLNTVAAYQKMMRRGADHAAMNYLHKWYLVEAERERVLGRDLKAMELYDRAIGGAKENGYVQEEALCNECAARFYLAATKEQIAASYMREAHSLYRSWGADTKVHDLERRYPQLLADTGASLAATESEAASRARGAADRAAGIMRLEELDLATVFKVSQVISGEIVLESLLEKLMGIVIEVSGAQRGLLILEKEGGFFVEAEGDAGGEKVARMRNVEVFSSRSLSHAVIHYVIRTKESVVLEEACEDELFHDDPYIVSRGLRSLLCAPIIHQGLIKGIIYLENNLTGGAFTEQRVEIVQLVAAQAAISLENARLYQSLLADIERRKAVEEELRSSEEMARSLLDALRDSLVLIDRDGRVLSLNRTTARSLGRKMNDIVGRPFWDLLPPRVSARRKRYVERAIRSAKAVRVVDEQDGRVCDNVIYPVVDSQGSVSRIAILERDITEQRKVEEQVEAQQLYLMRSDRLAMMGELAAGVAHEINNPNHSIQLNTALLMKAYPDILKVLDEHTEGYEGLRIGGLAYAQFRKTLEDSVKRISECAKRIGSIVKELKSFARPEPVEISEEVDVNVIVQSAILLGTPFIKQATDNFSIHLEEHLPTVRGNAQKIEQVLLNLLQNGCQSLSERSEAVSVGTNYDRARRRVIVEVRDEGRGMEDEVLSRITQPFFTTRKDSGGTGLGLSISSRIVEEHGGTLSFESEPGRGTIARVILPEGEKT
jgi:PAS domain S-box-containing protein